MPTAVRSRIMATPCIPIRATPLLDRRTVRVLQTSGLLPPPISRPKQHHQGVRLHPVGTSSSPEITCMGVCPHSKALQGGIQSQFLTAFYSAIMCLRIRYSRHYRIMKGARNEVKRQRLESSWSESHRSSAGETLLCRHTRMPSGEGNR